MTTRFQCKVTDVFGMPQAWIVEHEDDRYRCHRYLLAPDGIDDWWRRFDEVAPQLPCMDPDRGDDVRQFDDIEAARAHLATVHDDALIRQSYAFFRKIAPQRYD